MKKLIGIDIGSYTFDASEKTITLSNLTSLSLEQILVITNVTDNIIIYNFANSSKGGTLTPSGSDFDLVLDFDTTSMSDTDDLQIWIWEEEHYTTQENRNVLTVPTRASIPSEGTLKEIEGSGDVSDTTYTYYVIPNTTTIKLLSFHTVSEVSHDGNSSSVYYDEEGDFSDPDKIITLVTNGNSDKEYFDPEEYEYVGDGTARLVIERKPLGNGTIYIESILRAYEE